MPNVQCPTCQRNIQWSEEFAWRPFCSERCRLIDLGAWLTEKHAIPAEPDFTQDAAGSPPGQV